MKRHIGKGLCALAAALMAIGPAAAIGPLYDGSPGAPWWEFDFRYPGGVTVIYQPGQTITSCGGVFTPRWVKVAEADGTVTHFRYPSAFAQPKSIKNLIYGHGVVEVHVPDVRGLLYVNGEATPLRGPAHTLRTKLLDADQGPYTFQLRAAFRSGDRLLIEDRTVSVAAGQSISVTFDGRNAVATRLPDAGIEELPPPRPLPAEPR